MSIYIKGVDMPKNHNYVTITIWSNGTASYALHDRKESLVDFRNVEVVPIPPHGRGIDADALINDHPQTWTTYDLQRIANAHTILPADKPKEE